MRILQVTPRYAPNTGGVENHVQAISERMVELGHEVTVLTADAGSAGERQEEREGVSVHRYRSIAPGETIHVCPQIAVGVRRADVDVIHAHNYHSTPLAFTAIGVGKRRFIVTPHYHGRSADPLRDRLLSVYRPFGRWALGQADAVVAVSNWERNQLDMDLEVDAAVIPNGIDVERFAGASPVENDRPFLLSVGRLEEYKGIQYAIESLVELPAFDLLVAGEGPYLQELERRAKTAQVDDRVEFLGYVPDDQLPGLYAGAAAHLVLSSFEAYGMTVAESLATGTPCVVREAGGLVDWTEKKGVVTISSVKPRAVAEAVEQALVTDAEPSLPTWGEVCDGLAALYAGSGTGD